MTSPSSIFRPKLQDQEYMELVFENGQILAKCQRPNVSVENQRTKSIIDLYEDEYNEDFKKRIHGGCESFKNLKDTQVVPEYHHVDDDDSTLKASSSKTIEFIPPDEQSMVAERSVDLSFTFSSTNFTQDSEGCLSSSLDDWSDDDDVRPRVLSRTSKALVKRKRSAEVYNSPETKERNDINKKLRTLQDLLPNSHKENNESLLDEAINYMTTLQHQVQMMTMGNRFVTPSMILPFGAHYSQMGVPQFLPTPGISEAAHMLRLLNHPGLMPMQNSSLFTPMENQIPNSTSLPTLDDDKKSGKTVRR